MTEIRSNGKQMENCSPASHNYSHEKNLIKL